MLFKRYDHFHLLTTDGWTDAHSDYSAHMWVMQYFLDTCYTCTVYRFCEYIHKQPVLVRFVPELFVSRINCGGGGAAVKFLGKASSRFCMPLAKQCQNVLSMQSLIKINHVVKEI